MRRALILGVLTVFGLSAAGCTAPRGGAHAAAQSEVHRGTAAATTVPGGASCTPGAKVAGCPHISIETVSTQVRTAQSEADALEGSEQRYATCFSYAGLNQDLAVDAKPITTPGWQTCPTTGLTPAVVLEIQLILLGA